MRLFIGTKALLASALLLLSIVSSVASEGEAHVGFVDVIYHPGEDSIHLRLDKSQIGQHMIFQSSLPRGIGSNDIGLDRGQLSDTRLVKFERFGNKILLQQLNTKFRASSDNAAERSSIDEAFADSVIAGFLISEETDTQISFNYTDFLLSDIHGISDRLNRSGQGAYSVDKSRSGIYLERTKAFALNTELEALVTFAGSPKGQYIQDVTPDAKSVTVHLHHSFVALPDDGYTPRKFHPFSGFWKASHYDYSAPIDESMEVSYIPRHRLEKKNPQAEISEAVEPIVFYLDPGIPEPVMTALREGAMWWDQAFAAAGYKNAFQVKVLPDGADPMDVRYNVIQWVHRATRGWSYGSSVVDPRTGEIIKGHVTLGSLRVRQDFLIASGFTSPFDVENADTSEQLELALNRIRQLSAHEVGHTIGIAHNFAASENQRASVMDYPHPLITLENGKVNLKDAYDLGIGAWDNYVIAYGYQDFADDKDEQAELLALVNEAKANGFLYKSDPDARIPRRASSDGHLWDNGSDPIAEFERVSELRAHALANFGANSQPFDEPFSALEERLVPIYYSHRFQLDALVKQISGINYEYGLKTLAQPSTTVTPVAPERQRSALNLMVQSASPAFLDLSPELTSMIPPKAYGSARTRESMGSRMGIAFDPVTAAESASAYSLTILLAPERLNRLSYQHAQNEEIPSVNDVMQSVFGQLIKPENESALADRIRYVALSVFFDTLTSDTLAPEVQIEMHSALMDYQNYLEKQRRSASAKVLLKHIAHFWEHGAWPLSFKLVPLPPGSPI
ncbi:zinc-dependent metalloprotease [Glaciecola sp. XM2]|uniref:zinc-dependent metalloprotease n=1 Tax=Glaciecola sp. XM2 TaxID=1914931 RepID=UPI002032D305|nr:zinc-dependent metalloprotease [Glaciecola sp. XM2]